MWTYLYSKGYKSSLVLVRDIFFFSYLLNHHISWNNIYTNTKNRWRKTRIQQIDSQWVRKEIHFTSDENIHTLYFEYKRVSIRISDLTLRAFSLFILFQSLQLVRWCCVFFLLYKYTLTWLRWNEQLIYVLTYSSHICTW